MSKSNKCMCLLKWCTKCEKTSPNKGMVGYLIKKGITKDEITAKIILVCVSIFFFSLSPLMFVII